MNTEWGRASEPIRLSTADGIGCIAAWSELLFQGDGGVTEASVSATSYVRENGGSRPVTFVWNGGPGASSSPLHLNAFGPRRLVDGEVVENEHTLLPDTDLVFIDPVGTGFSKVPDDALQSRYFAPRRDADAVSAFVREWLRRHAREQSPVFLMGESYGGFRLGLVAPRLASLDLRGMMLVSPSLDVTASEERPENDLAYVFQFPTMAVAAWVHKKAMRDRESVDVVWAAAERFAVDDLLPALHYGGGRTERQRARLSNLASRFLGIPADDIAARRLRIDSEDFLRSLLREEGLLVGRLDVRVTGPMPDAAPEGRPAAADDPALGMGRTNVIHSEPLRRYLVDEIGVPSEDPYVSLSLEVNFAWDWRSETRTPLQFRTSALRDLGVALEQRPAARVLLTGGYYDLATPLAGTIHALHHAGISGERVQVVPLDGGHSLDAAVIDTARRAVSRFLAPAENVPA